ncbi:MAG: hypothetical protein ACTSYX_05575 [Candidatus Thorarchaeota archaeon]
MNIVKVEMLEPPPGEAVVDATYTIKGVATLDGNVGAPPWVYMRVGRKKLVGEEVEFFRAFPMPPSGEFSIDWTPRKEGEYRVSLVATPAPLPVPTIGVPPIVGESTPVTVSVSELEAKIENFAITKYGSEGVTVSPPQKLEVKPGSKVDVTVEFDYTGPEIKDALFHMAVFSWTLLDPHNEKAAVQVTRNIPESTEPRHITVTGTITLPTSGLPEGLNYGLLVVAKNLPGKDYYFYIGKNDPPYHQWVIEVTTEPGEPPEVEISNLRITGYGRDVSQPVTPPQVADFLAGDTCRVRVSFDYMGPEIRGAVLYAAIGVRGMTFDEKLAGQATITIPEVATPSVASTYVDIPITSIAPGTYDLYVKLTNVPGPDLYAYLNDVIRIVGLPAAVTIKMKNLPANTYFWQIVLYSSDLTRRKESFAMRPTGMTVWEDITPDWFPIYVDAMAYTSDNQIVWQVTSHPDFAWVDYYDPGCVIPDFGDYYLNAATNRFEVA